MEAGGRREAEGSRFIRSTNLVDFPIAFEEYERRPCQVNHYQHTTHYTYPIESAATDIAETLYREATSFAWSTSHFRKLTFVCLVERDSKCGAMA